MEVQIPLKKPVGNLATNAGGMIEIKLLGALNVIGEDIVIAVSPHGTQIFHWKKFREVALHAGVLVVAKCACVQIIQ